jgi:hypothetical protein
MEIIVIRKVANKIGNEILIDVKISKSQKPKLPKKWLCGCSFRF